MVRRRGRVDALSRNVTGVSVVGHADLQSPTQVDSDDEPMGSVGRFTRWYTRTAHCASQAQRLILLSPNDTTEAVVEVAGLGAPHSGRFAVAMDVDDGAVAASRRESGLRAKISRHFKTLHQRTTILLVCHMRAKQRHLPLLRLGRTRRTTLRRHDAVVVGWEALSEVMRSWDT